MKLVLMLHRVLPASEFGYHTTQLEQGLIVSTAYFDWLLNELTQLDYRFICCNELTRYKESDKVVALTFDDGYLDNYEHAFPLLKKHGAVATFFPVVSPCKEQYYLPIDVYNHCVQKISDDSLRLTYVKGARKKEFILCSNEEQWARLKLWFPSTHDIQGDDYMTPAQIKELHQHGMEIGSHTMSHPSMFDPHLSREKKQQELLQSAEILREWTEGPVTSFCFPYGHYTREDIRIVKQAGYQQVLLVNQDVSASKVLPEYPRVYVTEGITLQEIQKGKSKIYFSKQPSVWYKVKKRLKRSMLRTGLLKSNGQ